MIHATLRYYPQQANKNGTRGVWRVIHCHEVNYQPYKRAYTVTWGLHGILLNYRVMRIAADRMYKKGSRVDPRRMLGV